MKAEIIPRQDFYRDWHSLVDRIFTPEFMSLYKYVDSEAKSPFAAKNWQVLMLPFQLCSYALYAFEDRSNLQKEFEEDGQFSIADSLIWKAFIETVREIGDWQFISSFLPIDYELRDGAKRKGIKTGGNAVLYDLTDMSVVERSNFGGQYSFSPYAFGKSLRWGALSEHDNVTLVGGNEDFVRGFVERCGGLERIQERYLNLVEREMIYSDDQEFYVKLSKKIGWPVPHFEETNQV